MSLSSGVQLEAMRARLDNELAADPARRRELAREANKKLQALQAEWDGGSKLGEDDTAKKARLLRSLRTLDAILSVMPPEVRGEVGGFIKLATLGTDESRVAEIGRRIEKFGGLVERHLREEYREAIDGLFQAAFPNQGDGSAQTAVFNPYAQALVTKAMQASTLDETATGRRLTEIEAAMRKPDLSSEVLGNLEQLGRIVSLFGNLGNRTVEELVPAHDWLAGVLANGRVAPSKQEEPLPATGDDTDSAVILTLEQVAHREAQLRGQRQPFNDATRKQVTADISALRAFLPLLPPHFTRTLKRDDPQDSDQQLLRNLQDHIAALGLWIRGSNFHRPTDAERESEPKAAPQLEAKSETVPNAAPAVVRIPRRMENATPISSSALAFAMAAWCIVLAVADFQALWPYQLSKWALCAGSITLALRFGAESWRGVLSICIGIAFNPLAPIHFKDAWPVVDWIAAVALTAIAPAVGRACERGRLERAFQNAKRLFDRGVVVLLLAGGAALLIGMIWAILTGNMRQSDRALDVTKQWGQGQPMRESSAEIMQRFEGREREKNAQLWREFLRRTNEEERRTGRKGSAEDGSRIMHELRQEQAKDAAH